MIKKIGNNIVFFFFFNYMNPPIRSRQTFKKKNPRTTKKTSVILCIQQFRAG
jgi:hypothetical protein